MKAKYILAGIMTLTGVASTFADPPKGFEEFRNQIMGDFNSFKSRILEHYEDFLAGEWHEYESLEGTQKYSAPKPEAMPVITGLEVMEGDKQKKELLMKFGFVNDSVSPNSNVKAPRYLDWVRNTSKLYSAPGADMSIFGDEVLMNTEDTQSTPTASKKGDIMTEHGLTDRYDGDIFYFYGMKFGLPRIDFEFLDRVTEANDFSKQWILLKEQNVADQLAPSIKRLQETSGLSDYLLFELLMAYANQKMPYANDAAKMALTHHLLLNMEFALRLAIDDNGQPFMLIPFDEMIYERGYLPIYDNVYYLFETPGQEVTSRTALRTPQLPPEVDKGKKMSLRMKGLTLPDNPHHYSFEHDGIKIEGDMNQNIISMLYKYPQMETTGFAASTILQDVRDDVVRQVREQLGQEEPLRAADKLLSTIQFAFPYATDHENHGFEKPYFFEETLFYPQSDCEDRAMFYSYLLWNALGLENDLIAYPNHEATAIKAEKVWGGDMHYKRNGAKYFISDPTFQGAPTGFGMSQYREVEPVIDLSYSSEQ